MLFDRAGGLALQTIARCCFLAVLAASPLASGSSGPARLYDLTTATGMPHLEENLRYTLARAEQCLGREDLGSAFPMLRHPSLAGCRLREQSHDADTIAYVLVCENSTGTTGAATWHLGERALRGTLDVKLGGKNMTFYQRVTGTLIGECPPDR